MMPLSRVNLIDLPVFGDNRGNLSFIESMRHIPFDIKRVYYLYDVPLGQKRAAHAHKDLQQLFIPIKGSFRLELDDGYTQKSIVLSRPSQALYIPPMIWRDIVDFSVDAVCLVLASDYYTEDDYYRDYDDFIKNVQR